MPADRPPSDERSVFQWMASHPAWGRARPAEETRDLAAEARFFMLRQRFLGHLVRDPWLWVLQGRNVRRGLARLGLGLGLAPPVLAFWEPVVWPAVLGVGCLGLGLVDRLLGHRLSGFRNVFVDTAERLAWVVVATETPPVATAATDTRAPLAHEERRPCRSLASLNRC